MALKATYDILVQFTDFRNIDLYHQGVYYLRAQIYIPGEGAKPNPTRGSLDKNKKKKVSESQKFGGLYSTLYLPRWCLANYNWTRGGRNQK